MGRGLTTYEKARLQVVAYRGAMARVNEVLTTHGLNTSQWIILGWLHDNPEGLRVTELAEILQVETPLITALLRSLQAENYVDATNDIKDKRAKILLLSEEGHKLVSSVDTELAEHLKPLIHGLRRASLDTYFRVLGTLIHNIEPRSK